MSQHPFQPAVTLLALLRAGFGGGLLKSTFQRDVSPMLARFMKRDEVLAAFEEARRVLANKGLVQKRSGRARSAVGFTTAGERRAADAIGLWTWPEEARWAGTVKPRLIALALGCCDEAGLARTATADGLRREILRVRLGLEVTAKRVSAKAAQKAAEAVGAEGTSFQALRRALQDRAIEDLAFGEPSWPGLPAKPAETRRRRRAVSATRQPDFPETAPLTLEIFAAEVKRLAKETPTGRMGNSVFINHVWKYVIEAHPEWGLSLAEFKVRLKEAGLKRYIDLGRANILEVHLRPDVRASRIDPGELNWDLVDLARA